MKRYKYSILNIFYNFQKKEDIEKNMNDVPEKPKVVTKDQATNTDLTLICAIPEDDSSSDTSEDTRDSSSTNSDDLSHKLDFDENIDAEVTDSHILQSLNIGDNLKVNNTNEDFSSDIKEHYSKNEVTESCSESVIESNCTATTNNGRCDTCSKCKKFNNNRMNCSECPVSELEFTTYRL